MFLSCLSQLARPRGVGLVLLAAIALGAPATSWAARVTTAVPDVDANPPTVTFAGIGFGDSQGNGSVVQAIGTDARSLVVTFWQDDLIVAELFDSGPGTYLFAVAPDSGATSFFPVTLGATGPQGEKGDRGAIGRPGNSSSGRIGVTSPLTPDDVIEGDLTVTGRMGIGGGPRAGHPLFITHNGGGLLLWNKTSGGATPYLHFRDQFTTKDWVLQPAGAAFHIKSDLSSPEHLTVTEHGRVGIGRKSPTARLDVAGNIAINGAPIVDSAGKWVGDKAGLKGDPGPPGPPGPPVTTVAVCSEDADNGCEGLCSDVDVIAPAPCFVTSDTGSCELDFGGSDNWCCVCSPS